MLKITKNNLTLIIPQCWLDSRSYLKVSAICAIKLFFGDITLEQALEGAKKERKYGWLTKEVNDV